MHTSSNIVDEIEREKALVASSITVKINLKNGKNNSNSTICWYCSKSGHVQASCYKRERQKVNGGHNIDNTVKAVTATFEKPR